MIVGTTNIDYEDIKLLVGKPEELIIYAESLVPVWARHITCLAHNQRFYIAIHLRRVLSIPYKLRIEMCEALISGINVRGVMSSFTSITEILDVCNKEMLVEMLKRQVLLDAEKKQGDIYE